MAQTFQEIIAQQASQAREKRLATQQGGATYNQPERFKEYDVGGTIYDSSGKVVTGRTGTAKTGQIVGIEQDDRQFNLGDYDTGRLGIQRNVVAGANEGGGQTREQSQADLRKAYEDSQQRTTDLTDAQRAEKDKFLKDTGTQAGGSGVSTLQTLTGEQKQQRYIDAGISSGAPKTISELGDIDFSAELGLNPNMPRKSEKQTDTEYALDVANWKLENLATAYNATMKQKQLDKIKEINEKNEAAILRTGNYEKDTRTQSQIDRDLKAEFEGVYNGAKNTIESEERAVASASIEKFKNRVLSRASEKVATSLIEKYKAEQDAKAEQRIQERLATARESVDKARKETAKKISDNNKVNITKTPAQLATESKNKQIKAEFDKIKEADPTISDYEAFSRAKLNTEALTGKTGTEAQKIEELNDLFASATFREKNKGNEFSISFGKLKDLSKTKDYLMETQLMSEKEVNDQLVGYIKAKRPEMSDSDIKKNYIQSSADSNDQTNFINGTGEVQDTLNFMNNLEINSPDKAKRVYEKVLAEGTYIDDPAMESNIKRGLASLGGSAGDLTFEQQLNIPSIGRMLYGARISDKETERVQKIVTSPEAAELDRFGLIQRILGFDVKQNSELGESLLNQIVAVNPEEGLAGFDMLGLAKLLNEGKTPAAIRKVENFSNSIAKKTEGDAFVSESFVQANFEKYNDVVKTMDKIGIDKGVGAVAGSFNNWFGRFKPADAKAVGAELSAAVAQMRNKLLGSAVTPAEEAFLEDVLPKATDSAEEITIKLDNLKENALIELNSMRDVYGLPRLGEPELLDKKLKERLYLGTQSQEELTPLSERFGEVSSEPEFDTFVRDIEQKSGRKVDRTSQTLLKMYEAQKPQKKTKKFPKIEMDSAFNNKLEQVSSNLGINRNDLEKAIGIETAGTFNPAIKNPKSSATGLIQFTEQTAKNLGTTTDELSKMTRVEQMDFVEKYLKDKGTLKNAEDVYMAIFAPAALGKADNYVVYGEREAKLNPAISQGRNQITVADIRKFVKNKNNA